MSFHFGSASPDFLARVRRWGAAFGDEIWGQTAKLQQSGLPQQARLAKLYPVTAAARQTLKTNKGGTMRTLLGAVLLFVAMAAGAGESATIPDAAPAKNADFGFAFLGALEFGGDPFATVFFTDGSAQDVKTGQGVTLGFGGRYRAYPDAPAGVRSTIGYKFVSTKASDADIGIDRWVWDVVGNYRFGNDLWLGAGFVRHMNIKFDGGGIGPDADFDDANGLRLELGWSWLALSYTDITYKDESGNTYDASSAGLVLTNAF